MKKRPTKVAIPGLWLTAIMIMAVVSIGRSTGQKKSIADIGTPTLVNTFLFTSNVNRLVEFYESVLALKAKKPDDTYAEFSTGVGVLAIFSREAEEKYIPGSTEGAKNGSMVLEFKVANVDTAYKRLKGLVKIWVKPPTTQPWESRSIYFRDPDGNLVDFYTLIKTK
jgi:catechol 2,3-dioxygenase-like lactoylglutathione lyase family enzyme